MLHSWLRCLFPDLATSRRRKRYSKAKQVMFRPQVEWLEDRLAPSATLMVNSTADGNNRDSVLTLREAILVNNRTLSVASLTADEQARVSGTPTATDADTIILPSGTYTLTVSGTGENAAATGDLDITEDVAIKSATGKRADVIIQAGTTGANPRT